MLLTYIIRILRAKNISSSKNYIRKQEKENNTILSNCL